MESPMTIKNLLEQLKKYKPYEGKSDNYIRKTIGGGKAAKLDELKQEYNKLSANKSKFPKNVKHSNNLIYLEDVGYTTEDLIKMVNYYKENVTIPNLPTLNNNINKILLNADTNALKNLCLTNKLSYNICVDTQFWKDKFIHNDLPQLVIVSTYNDNVIPKTMRQLPININGWIKAYDKMLNSHQLAVKFVDNILNTKRFILFSAVEDLINLLWLSNDMIEPIVNNEIHEIQIFFETKIRNNKHTYYIQLIVSREEEEEEERLEDKCSKQEFINYLTLLIYYGNKDLGFNEVIEHEGEEDNEAYLTIEDLKKETKNLKNVFPDW
jgi:hypothetical protein